MSNMDFQVDKDIEMIQELQEISKEQLASKIGVARFTIERWEKSQMDISEINIEKLYSYAYEHNIYI